MGTQRYTPTSIIVLIFFGLAIVAGIGWIIVANTSQKQIPSGGYIKQEVSACEMLTMAKAQTVLGAGTKFSADSSAIGNKETADSKVTNCNYVKPTERIQDAAGVTLTIRQAKTQAGINENAKPFETPLQDGNVRIDGYGQGALWDQFQGKLYILKNNNRYELGMSIGLNGTKVQLSTVQELADSLGLKGY